MLALADFSDEDGVCWPSQESLARLTRMTERGIRGMIPSLVKSGELEILRQGGGRGTSTKYRVIVEEKEERETRNDKPGLSNPVSETRNDAAERRNGTAIKAEQLVPGIRKEPSIDPPKKKTICDEEFLKQLQDIHPEVNVPQEFSKARTWVLANPHRKLTQRFFANWVNRAKLDVRTMSAPLEQQAPKPEPDPEGWTDWLKKRGMSYQRYATARQFRDFFQQWKKEQANH